MSDARLSITPEQLIALNDEIATLVRSGVPLQLGLKELSRNVPTALGKISREISNRLEEGKTLGDSLSSTLPGLPRVYLAVVDAGLKSGDLPRALQAMSRFAQQGLELRHRIEFAFMYPLIIFLLAYVLFLTFVIETVPHWQQIWGEFAPLDDPFVRFLSFLGRTWKDWIWIPPGIVVVLAGWWLYWGRFSFLPDRRPSAILRIIPGLRSVIGYWHWANFCDLLATLLEHHVPLPTAMNLAANATGNSAIHSQMNAVSEELKSGKSMAECLRPRTRIPPYLRWTLGSAQQPAAFQNALRHGTEVYRSRATFRADMIKMWLPLALIITLGWGSVMVYSLSMALPLRALYQQLNSDSMR